LILEDFEPRKRGRWLRKRPRIPFRSMVPIISVLWGITLLVAIVSCAIASPPGISTASTDQLATAPERGVGSGIVYSDIWVDPVLGSDQQSGGAPDKALRTLTAAWEKVPKGAQISGSGIRINLMPGDFREADMPGYWEDAKGTASFPIVIRASGGRHTTRLHAYIDMHTCSYLSFVDLDIVTDQGYGGGGNVLHIAESDHIRIEGCTLSGYDGVQRQPQETLKANQVKYLDVEDCDISGAFWYALDYVAVQYGSIRNSSIYDAGEFCMVIKGGSAYLTIEGCEIYGGDTGAISAGSGTGFNWMVPPWVHYEISSTRFINNLVHDTGTVGLSVNGGYNVLMAHNTLYRVGINDHAIEACQGQRGCDGDTPTCRRYLSMGGWGTTGANRQFIPNKNVFIYNNIIYNPAGSGSRWQHFIVQGPVTPPAGSNVPAPSRADENLQIKGNLIWNGPPESSDLPLLGEDGGCDASNPTCSAVQIRADNTLNKVEPALQDPDKGDFHPISGGNVYKVAAVAIPPFPGGDRPSPPLMPEGDLENEVTKDYGGALRPRMDIPGAYRGSSTMTYPRVSHLINTTYLSDTIRWTWEVPRDPGFNGSVASLNGVFLQNLSSQVASFTCRGLTPATPYTFSLQTIGTLGSIDPVQVSHTARTAPHTRLPDLTITRLENISAARAGSKMAVQLTLENSGTVTAGRSTVVIFLSKDRTRSNEDISIATRVVHPIRAGQYLSLRFATTVPATTQPGDWYLIATIDSQGQITESDESNNTRASTATVRIRAG
jgi:hypothetical protein